MIANVSTNVKSGAAMGSGRYNDSVNPITYLTAPREVNRSRCISLWYMFYCISWLEAYVSPGIR
jgi:hypothetical protein